VNNPTAAPRDGEGINRRLESIALPVFLLMLGALALVPRTAVPQGVWATIAGVALLALNYARHHYGIRISLGSTILGVILFVSGVANLLGKDLPMFEILFVTAVANLVFYSLAGRGRKGDPRW